MTDVQKAYSVGQPFQAAGITIHQADTRWGAREFFANSLQIFREPP
jgi:hypothetical protein